MSIRNTRLPGQTNVISPNSTNVLDRNSGVNVSQRLSDLITSFYSENYYKFQSNTFFALVIGETGQRNSDIRTVRHIFHQMENASVSSDAQQGSEPATYPSCKVRILEVGHSMLGDPTDASKFNFSRLNDLENTADAGRAKSLNTAFVDIHGIPAYLDRSNDSYPEYGDIVLVEVDNIIEPKDVKVLQTIAKKIIEPINFYQREAINPPAPATGSGLVDRVIQDAIAATIVDPDESGLLPEARSSDLDSYDRLEYFIYDSTTRDRAVQPQLLVMLQTLAEQTNTWLEIISAGQPSMELIGQYPSTYTGSLTDYRTNATTRRHDFGWAVDVRIRRNGFNSGSGKENFIEVNTRNENTINLLRDFAEKAYSLGITGIGAGNGYMNSSSPASAIHLDMAFNNNLEGNSGLSSRYWGGFPCDGNPPTRTNSLGEVFNCYENGRRQSDNAPAWLRQAAGYLTNSQTQNNQNEPEVEEEEEVFESIAPVATTDYPQGLIDDFEALSLPIPGGALRSDTVLVADKIWNVVEPLPDQSNTVNGLLAGEVVAIYRTAIEPNNIDIGHLVEIEVQNPSDDGIQRYFIAGLDSGSIDVSTNQFVDSRVSITNTPPSGYVYFSTVPPYDLAVAASEYNDQFRSEP